MSVDYTAIADADPGGDLNSAFDTMDAETVVKSRGKYLVTQMDIAEQLGLDAAVIVRDAFEAAVAANQLPSWVVTAMDAGGININHQGVATKVGQMVTASELTQAQADAFLDLGNATLSKWPGLKHGHLQNAREKRARGEI